jgi:hypothetical protein
LHKAGAVNRDPVRAHPGISILRHGGGSEYFGALADKLMVEQALKDSQAAVGRAVKQASYQKIV